VLRLITCGGKEQYFDGGRSDVVVVVVVVVVARAGGRRAAAAAFPGAASWCARGGGTRRAALPAHLVDDRLQLRDGRQARYGHVRRRLETQLAQNVVADRRVAVVALRLHTSQNSVPYGPGLRDCSDCCAE